MLIVNCLCLFSRECELDCKHCRGLGIAVYLEATGRLLPLSFAQLNAAAEQSVDAKQPANVEAA